MNGKGIWVVAATTCLLAGGFAHNIEAAPEKPVKTASASPKESTAKTTAKATAKPDTKSTEGPGTGTVSATKTYSKNDAGVYARINDLKQLAKTIKIDGKADDWAGFPKMTDPADFTCADASRDIISTAIAPTDDALYIMVKTKGAPSKENLAFWIDVDYMGGSAFDYQIGITVGSNPRLWIFPERQERITTNLEGAEVKIGEVIEIKIPNKALVKQLPQKMTPFLHGPLARPWVRVRPSTWSTASERFVDYGPAAASYRLAFPLPGLDFQLIHPELACAQIESPVRGKWFIVEGPTHTGDRAYQWACDLIIVDAAHNHFPLGSSAIDTFNYCWNKPVYSPVLGIVNRVKNDLPDSPHPQDSANQPANEALIAVSHSPYLLWLSSLKLGSVTVKPGTSLIPGMLIGNVGNSNAIYSPRPHLHIDVSHYIGDRTSIVPMSLRNVRVGLNFTEDDPWARELSSWEPREGLFITPLP